MKVVRCGVFLQILCGLIRIDEEMQHVAVQEFQIDVADMESVGGKDSVFLQPHPRPHRC